MKSKLLSFVFLMTALSITAQTPDWSVKASDYQYSMTFTLFLSVDGKILTNTNDKVGAFINGTSRGEANLVFNANTNKYVAYLTVLTNTTGETISFKIYDSENDVVVTPSQTEIFEINKNVGGAFQSYSVAAPPLRLEMKLN